MKLVVWVARVFGKVAHIHVKRRYFWKYLSGEIDWPPWIGIKNINNIRKLPAARLLSPLIKRAIMSSIRKNALKNAQQTINKNYFSESEHFVMQLHRHMWTHQAWRPKISNLEKSSDDLQRRCIHWYFDGGNRHPQNK